MRAALRRLAGFVACLFDAHDLRYDSPCDWNVCARCGEVRLTAEYMKWRYRK